jgi:hypothetical protein
MRTLILLLAAGALGASPALSDDKKGPAKVPATNAPSGLSSDDPMVVTSKTKFDFGEAVIEGQMSAPQGFFLQGKNSQTLSQLVKLRADFKNELRNSKSAVKALAK